MRIHTFSISFREAEIFDFFCGLLNKLQLWDKTKSQSWFNQISSKICARILYHAMLTQLSDLIVGKFTCGEKSVVIFQHYIAI